MKTLASTALAGILAAAVLAAAPARADVFSSQSFTGETTSLNALPGVNLDAGSGVAAGNNCVDTTVPSYSMRGVPHGGTMTECRFGNFSLSTVRPSSAPNRYDMTYGGNPPPWQQGWRP